MFERGAEERIIDGTRLRLDRSEQVLRLEAPDPMMVQLSPTPQIRPPGFVSAALLAAKAKQFDDGLYAAVECWLDSTGGKRDLLDALLLRLQSAGDGPAVRVLAAARELDGGSVPAALAPGARELAREFLADELRSRPLGFYTYSAELERIFRRDRMLQSQLGKMRDVSAVAGALHGAPPARAVYERALRVAERLTNALAAPDFRPWLAALDAGRELAPEPELAFFPPSRAHETDLVMRLYGDRPIPEGFDLAGEMISAIRSGALELTPKDASGWYDWQLWSLETLVAPGRGAESAHLEPDTSYLRHLEKLFRAIVTLSRETHVKQLQMPAPGGAPPMRTERPLVIAPDLGVEPLPTHYWRRAQAYGFVRLLLAGELGDRALGEMRRRSPDGVAAMPLGEELDRMQALFDAAAWRCKVELGMPPEGGDDAALGAFHAGLSSDPDVGRDTRCMVPVYYDRGRRRIKVMAVLGWMDLRLKVSFARPPRIELLDGPRKIELGSAHHWLATPVAAEALVTRLLDRDEFRALCDRHRTPEAIVCALEAD